MTVYCNLAIHMSKGQVYCYFNNCLSESFPEPMLREVFIIDIRGPTATISLHNFSDRVNLTQ